MAVIVKGTVVNSAPVFKVLRDVHGLCTLHDDPLSRWDPLS